MQRGKTKNMDGKHYRVIGKFYHNLIEIIVEHQYIIKIMLRFHLCPTHEEARGRN